jgi:hypothetical protein
VCPKRFPCPWYIRHKPCTYLALRLKQSPNRSKWPSTWSTSPRSAINCFKNDFWAYGTFNTSRAPVLHRDWWHLHPDQNKIPLDPCHIGVPSVASKWFMSQWTFSTNRAHISKWTETSFHLTNVTKKYHRVCLRRFPCPWFIWHKPYTYLASSLTLSPNVGVPLVALKIISEPMVRLTQIVHLSCIEINTISKHTETIFHLIYAT